MARIICVGSVWAPCDGTCIVGVFRIFRSTCGQEVGALKINVDAVVSKGKYRSALLLKVHEGIISPRIAEAAAIREGLVLGY